ncbi:MAG: MBL fold metallo-hydrolase [Xanthomonadales bacterium]|nr:MBL fold metallo-hydrolase [Xanthomonadales bacterium]
MTRSLIAALLLGIAGTGHGQVVLPDWDTVTVNTTNLGNGLYVLEGFGGNIGVLTGPDGVLLVDDQYDQLSEKNLAAIRELSSQPIHFVINTHWHGDHVGANAAMQALGAHIISTDETRVFMEQYNATLQETHDEQPMALPVATFRDQMTFHMNGQQVRVLKVRSAHTAGDAVVEFQPANVIHMGDASFNGFYPFIDVANGGSIDGMIELHQEIHDRANDRTVIVFGHGPNGERADLLRYRAMLMTVRDRVAAALDAGIKLDKLVASTPLADLDPEYGDNLIKAPVLLEMVYKDLSKNGW